MDRLFQQEQTPSCWPKMIDQSVWRAGLKAPDFERIVHEVHNVIVHPLNEELNVKSGKEAWIKRIVKN